MLTLSSPQVVQETVLRWKKEQKIAFVPTMGALHHGHLALVEMAKKYGNRVIVSIFVNPLQFGPKEDFKKYPRPIEDDTAKLEEAGADLLFVPDALDFYPAGFDSRVKVGALSESLCGQSRPGHFEGVATVCLKLFQITQPDFAIFGEKDYQQLRVLQQMAFDFNLPLAIVPHPIVREADGLALSSRNTYLSADERRQALALSRGLRAAEKLAKSGERDVGTLVARIREFLTDAKVREDYVAVVHAQTLRPIEKLEPGVPARALVAAFVGKTRLIDNVGVVSG